MQDYFSKFLHYTLILADGEKPAPEFFLHFLKTCDKFIAADGAANWALKHNFIPDIVIGDFDSIEKRNRPIKEYIHMKDQDTNDLEKCLQHCLIMNCKDVLICGAFGLRIDHFLTNLYTINKFSQSMRLILIDDKQSAFICPPHKPLRIKTRLHDFISLFPLGSKVGPITLEGVEHPLKEEYLCIRQRMGTLNICHDRVRLICKSPNLLTVLPFERLKYNIITQKSLF